MAGVCDEIKLCAIELSKRQLLEQGLSRSLARGAPELSECFGVRR
jgi:hypothetical protein